MWLVRIIKKSTTVNASSFFLNILYVYENACLVKKKANITSAAKSATNPRWPVSNVMKTRETAVVTTGLKGYSLCVRLKDVYKYVVVCCSGSNFIFVSHKQSVRISGRNT